MTRSELRLIWVATGTVALLGLAAEVADYRFGAPDTVVEFFSLSYEKNLPTWYASALLLACAFMLARVATRADEHTRRWRILSAVFAFMSLDEAVEIHEHLGQVVGSGGHALLHFSWVLPASAILVAFGLFMLPLVHLRQQLRHLQFGKLKPMNS